MSENSKDVVAEIEKLIMHKTAPKGHELEWTLLYLAGCEIRRLRAKFDEAFDLGRQVQAASQKAYYGHPVVINPSVPPNTIVMRDPASQAALGTIKIKE